ncbi:MAG: hypothetical protein Q8P90_03545 [bacterium]|nr:hypothetical protein [bacterium]
MPRKTVYSIGFMLASVLLLGGCIKMDMQQTINKDGSSHVKIVNDLTAFGEFSQLDDASLGAAGDTAAGDELSQITENLDSACDDFYADTTMENAVCVRDEYIITMEGDLQLTEDIFDVKKSLPYITYSYDATNAFALMNETGGEQSKQLDETAISEAKASADLIGMELNYTLTMPAPITNSSVGVVTANQVVIDVFDLSGEEAIYIESQDLNWAWIIGGSVILLFLLALIILVLVLVIKRKMRIKKMTKTASQMNQPMTELKSDNSTSTTTQEDKLPAEKNNN